MPTTIELRNYRGLAKTIAIAIGLCLVVNAFVFGLGWDTDTVREVPFAPPGYVVGIVWVTLFALIGASWWLLRLAGEDARGVRNWLVFLILFCFAYPFYTLGLSSEILGLMGNIATFAVTAYIIRRAWAFSATSAFLLVPILGWLIFATVIIFAEVGWIA